jgi:hypothetical protein
MNTTVDNQFRLPTVIQVEEHNNSIIHYIIDGHALKKSRFCILLEETTLWKKSTDTKYIPTLLYDKPEGTRPYSVILLPKQDNQSNTRQQYHAKLFDVYEDAMQYYTCSSQMEPEVLKV